MILEKRVLAKKTKGEHVSDSKAEMPQSTNMQSLYIGSQLISSLMMPEVVDIAKSHTARVVTDIHADSFSDYDINETENQEFMLEDKRSGFAESLASPVYAMFAESEEEIANLEFLS